MALVRLSHDAPPVVGRITRLEVVNGDLEIDVERTPPAPVEPPPDDEVPDEPDIEGVEG